MDNTKSYEDLIIAFLRSKNGDVVLVTSLAQRYLVGQASVVALMNELAAAGKVRRSNAKRTVGYYIPTDAMLNAERRANDAHKPAPPLKIDKRRAELYAEIAASRAALPSIG